MKNTTIFALFLVGVLMLSVFVLPGDAKKPVNPGKPDPKPEPRSEPTGNLAITPADQLVVKVTGYVRVYNWDSGQFDHVWSGDVGGNWGAPAAIIGDVDNDGTDDVVAAYSDRTKIKGKYYYTYKFKIWQDGDASNSPSVTTTVSGLIGRMEIGDVDEDGDNELVLRLSGRIVEVWDCTTSSCTKQATITQLGGGGLTVADADNDGYDEILVGMGENAYGYYCHGLVIDYSGGNYSVVADLGPADTYCCIDEMSVGDLDGVAGNEIFGSGWCNGNIYVWQYSNGSYNQLWTATPNTCYNQQNEVADFDGDGDNEIAFSNANLPGCAVPETLSIYSYAGSNTWTLESSYSGCPGNKVDMAVSGQPDDDDPAELVVQNTVWDWNGTALTKVQTISDATVKDVAMG